VILNNLDLGGPSHPFATPVVGQEVGDLLIEGSEYAVWPRGSLQRRQSATFWAKAWQALGGQAANSSGATKYLLKQIEELASNRDLQPVYIQWNATADPTALLNATEAHDGWYIIADFSPNYARNVITGLVQCRMTVTEVAATAPRRVAMAYQGAALSTNFSGTATNLLSLPVGSTALEANFNRTAAEGAVPCILSPVASPEPVVLSATLANIFKGGVHVYDTINTGSNPVPTSGGTFVNANWVEVFYSDHNFAGDCVITNGLQLLIFIQGTAHLCSAYLWNTATAQANWQKYADVNYQDVAGNIGTLQGYTQVRIGAEESSVVTTSSTSGGKNAQVKVRLQRGRYEARADFMPAVEASTTNTSLSLVVVATPKILYNSAKIADNVLSETSPAFPTDYGYGATFVANSAQPFVCGFLYQNEAGNAQPFDAGNVATVGLGDNTSLAAGAQRSYGFWAIPYGVNASYSTANLQAEAESGTLGTGWTSQANASASGGNEAKCASGTATTNADLWGTAFVPDPGTYDLWMRVKVTSAASGTAQMQLGLWDSTSSAYVNSTTYAPNQFTTSYAWYKICSAVTPTAGHNMRVRAVVNTNATNTDWFIDESALVPRTLTTDSRGPQDLFQQWLYDRGTRLVRP
jgi:hypothetical protein